MVYMLSLERSVNALSPVIRYGLICLFSSWIAACSDRGSVLKNDHIVDFHADLSKVVFGVSHKTRQISFTNTDGHVHHEGYAGSRFDASPSSYQVSPSFPLDLPEPELHDITLPRYVQGKEIFPYKIHNRGGGELLSCNDINMALPAGLHLQVAEDGIDCVVRGTPTELVGNLSVSIAASNLSGTSSARVSLTVVPVLSLPTLSPLSEYKSLAYLSFVDSVNRLQ